MPTYGFQQKSFQSKRTNFVFCLLLVLVVFVWALVLSPIQSSLFSKKQSPELKIDFINAGLGDSALIRTPGGKTFLIDAGAAVTSSDAKREGRVLVQNFLREQKVGYIDGIVITNWSNDHFGAITSLVKNVYCC